MLVSGNVDIGKAAEDEVHLIAADTVSHGTQIAYASLFRREISDVGAINILDTISCGKFRLA